jgi:hypothetical protein
MADYLEAEAEVLWLLGIEAAVEEEHADVVIRGIDADAVAVVLALVAAVAEEVAEGLVRLDYPAHRVLFLAVPAPWLL